MLDVNSLVTLLKYQNTVDDNSDNPVKNLKPKVDRSSDITTTVWKHTG